MSQRIAIFVAFVGFFVCASGAPANFFDDFGGYADQTGFQAVWPSWATDGSSLALGPGYVHREAWTSHAARNGRNLDSLTDYAGTDAAPVKFQFSLYDAEPTGSLGLNAKDWVELRAYAGDGLPKAGGAVGLEGLIAMGLNTSPTPSSQFHARVMGGGANNWYALNAVRTPGWHQLTAFIGASWVQFYVDGSLDTVVSLPSGPIAAFDGAIIGSGVSNGYDVAFDDILVEKTPEPATLLLLAAGGLLARRRRSV
jgi:PEP-CTERM motif